MTREERLERNRVLAAAYRKRDPERMRANSNRSKAKFRAKRREMGLCLECGKQRDSDKVACATCRHRVSLRKRNLYAIKRASGLCPCGATAFAGRSKCERCIRRSGYGSNAG